MHSDDQRVPITSNLDVIEQALRVKCANRLLHTNRVDTIANIDWQVIEDRTLGDSLQALHPHVAHDEIGSWAKRQAYGNSRHNAAIVKRLIILLLPSVLHPLAKYSRDIVVKGKTHQKYEREYSELLSDDLRAFGQRAAFDQLNRLVDNLAAIKNRHRQQVQHAQADADQSQKSQEFIEPALGRISRKLCDINGPADVLDRHVTRDHPAEHAHGETSSTTRFSATPVRYASIGPNFRR